MVTKKIYDMTFSIFEVIVMGFPIIPSKIEIRAGILFTYFALYQCNVPQLYTKWKRKIKRSHYNEYHNYDNYLDEEDIEKNITLVECSSFNNLKYNKTMTSEKSTITDVFLSSPSNYNYDLELDTDLQQYNILSD